MSAITPEQVRHLAHLARIDLADDEVEHLTPQLDAILAWVAEVGEVAGDDVAPTSHPLPLTNVFRPDELTPCLSVDEVLAAAPAVEGQRFRVPRILGEEA